MWRIFRICLGNISGHQPHGAPCRFAPLTTKASDTSDDVAFENEDPDVFGTLSKQEESFASKTYRNSRFSDPHIKKQIDDLKNSQNRSRFKSSSDNFTQKLKNVKNIFEEDYEVLYKTDQKLGKSLITSSNKLRNAEVQKQDNATKLLKPLCKDFVHTDDFGSLDEFDHSEKYVGDELEKKMEIYERQQDMTGEDIYHYAKRMDILATEGKINEALAILQNEMPSDGVKPDGYCYGKILKGCSKIGHAKLAYKIYIQMLKEGIRPKNVIYTQLFTAFSNCPYPEEGLKRTLKLRENLKSKQIILNEINYNSMIKAFGRGGRLDIAMELVDEMVTNKVKVTQNTISFVLQSCISDKEAGFRHALMAWRKMRSMHIKPTIHHFNLLLRCAYECKAGDSALITETLREAATLPLTHKERTQLSLKVKENSDPSVQHNQRLVVDKAESGSINYEVKTINSEDAEETVATLHPVSTKLAPPTILAEKPSLGSIESVSSLEYPVDRLAVLGGSVGFITQMMSYDVQPDLKTFTQMLNLIQSNAKEEQFIMDMMKHFNVTPDTAFFNLLIKKRNIRGDTEDAKAVLELLADHHLMPDVITFGCLAVGCKTLYSAEQLLEDMDKIGCRPNMIIMETLTRKALHKDSFFHALEISRKLKKYQIKPTEKYIQAMEHARTRARSHIRRLEKIKKEEGTLTTEDERYYNTCKLFVLEYKNWLKDSTMEVKDLPWAIEATEEPMTMTIKKQ